MNIESIADKYLNEGLLRKTLFKIAEIQMAKTIEKEWDTFVSGIRKQGGEEQLCKTLSNFGFDCDSLDDVDPKDYKAIGKVVADYTVSQYKYK